MKKGELENRVETLESEVANLKKMIYFTPKLNEAMEWLMKHNDHIVQLRDLKQKFPIFKIPHHLIKFKNGLNPTEIYYISGGGNFSSRFVVIGDDKLRYSAIQIFFNTKPGNPIRTTLIGKERGLKAEKKVREHIIDIFNNGNIYATNGRIQGGIDLWHLTRKN